LPKIFVLLQDRTGNDFSLYKHNTIVRRVERRMRIHHIETIGRYVQFLQRNAQELDMLFEELLIGVTSFFRDPPAFEALHDRIGARLQMCHMEHRPMRVWVPACSTGEEAYSVAMTILEAEAALKLDAPVPVRIFATDLNKDSVECARRGTFPANIASDLTSERLERFFVRDENTYQIVKEIREMIVFAPQNIIMDPPFTKLDLLVCRNLLIYLTAELQKKVLSLFRYGISPGGILFLGASETIGNHVDLFAPLDTKWRIYQRRVGVLDCSVDVDLGALSVARRSAPAISPSSAPTPPIFPLNSNSGESAEE
jgi:two-component system, chemotaxis family, CheB/CheR fusion protein